MEKLEDGFLKFNPDTLDAVRQELDLDKASVLKHVINIENWLVQQDHFVKKDFSREYLERLLICCKGSVEKTKLKLDQLCTIKHLLPQYFESSDARSEIEIYDNLITITPLPQLTKNHERVLILRNLNYCGPAGLLDFYKYLVKLMEYFKAYDYSKGIIVIIDYNYLDLKNLLPKLDMVELRQIVNIVIESSAIRVKKIYFISKSKLIDTLIKITKQVLPKKISGRIQVYKDYKKLYKDLPIEILPEEYEGPERCIDDLHDQFVKILTSEEFLNHWNEIRKAITNEAYRDSNKFNERYLGAPGSLKTITFD